jgi:hypothetical protein
VLSIQKILYVYLPIVSSLFYLIILFLSLKNYNGNLGIYIIYNFLILYFFLYSFLISDFFSDKFLSIFIYLGFGFKLIFSFYHIGHLNQVSNALIARLDCNLLLDCRSAKLAIYYSEELYNKGLVVGIYALLSLIIISALTRKFLKIPCFEKISEFKTNSKYNNYRLFVITFLILISIIITIINFKFGIFQKGINSNYIIQPIFTWLLMFGLSSFFCVFLYLEFIRNKSSIFIMLCICFFENFCSSISSLSRGMIYNSSSYFLALGKIKDNKYYLKTIYVFIVMTSLFFFSLYLSMNFRKTIYSDDYISHQKISNPLDFNNIIEFNIKARQVSFKMASQDLEKYFSYNVDKINKETSYFFKYLQHIFINRFIGISELILMVESNKTSLNLFKSFILEKRTNNPSLYDKVISGLDLKINREYFNPTGMPGFIGFLYSSGSIIIVILGICFFYQLSVFIERLTFTLSKQNIFLTAMITQTLTYRLIHFGVNTSQSYKFLLAIFFTIFICSLITKFFIEHIVRQK